MNKRSNTRTSSVKICIIRAVDRYWYSDYMRNLAIYQYLERLKNQRACPAFDTLASFPTPLGVVTNNCDGLDESLQKQRLRAMWSRI